MIEVSGLYKKYGSYLAVKDANFSIGKGEIVGFLGPNGAGKSTIMNIVTGYLSLTKGKVTVDGFDITKEPEKAKRRIGYLPEIPPLYQDMTPKEYLDFIFDLKKVKFPKKLHIEEIMKTVGIQNVQNRLIKTLSKGYKQRVGFAQALVGNPDVLILDEPTVGLDPKQIIAFRELIERLGKNHTIILSSHILSEIQAVCKRVIIINKGIIIADGSFEELSKNIRNDIKLNLCAVCDGEAVLSAVKATEGVLAAEITAQNPDGSYYFEITPESGRDIRIDVSQAVTSAGGKIVSYGTNNVSLEQVFLRLTENADNEEALSVFDIKDDETQEPDETQEINEETKEENDNESDI